MSTPDQAQAKPLVQLQAAAWDHPVGGQGSDWTLRQGEFWVVGGHNGSGKTSFLNVVAGLSKLTRGRLLFFGREADQYSRVEQSKLRRKIGFVFEDNGRLFTDLNIAENVALPIGYHHNRRMDALAGETMRILTACQLETLGDRMPNELNRGLKRRVALARALATEPEILLVDSPLTGLDPVHIKWWTEFLPRLLDPAAFEFRTPSAVVVTGEDFRHWLGPEKCFALLQSGNLHPLGDAKALEANSEPMVQEMMSERTSLSHRH